MPKSKSDVHITPDRVFDIIKERYGYDKSELFDPCPVNPKFDGLSIPWKKVNIVNPPYTDMPLWVAKACSEAMIYHNTSIMLLPSKTDQKWFHYIHHWHRSIVWIQGRLKFKNNKHLATQPHFLVVIN